MVPRWRFKPIWLRTIARAACWVTFSGSSFSILLCSSSLNSGNETVSHSCFPATSAWCLYLLSLIVLLLFFQIFPSCLTGVVGNTFLSPKRNDGWCLTEVTDAIGGFQPVFFRNLQLFLFHWVKLIGQMFDCSKTTYSLGWLWSLKY